jgi:transcriptional regulator with XRE-family HTH domain
MTDELLRAWGINVKSLRQARGLSQKQLAEKVRVSVPTVCRWEKGNASPRDSHKVRVADALGADVRTLFPLLRHSA